MISDVKGGGVRRGVPRHRGMGERSLPVGVDSGGERRTTVTVWGHGKGKDVGAVRLNSRSIRVDEGPGWESIAPQPDPPKGSRTEHSRAGRR